MGSNRPELRDRLILAEGVRLRPYLDTKNRFTIGVGRNLEDVGISDEEAFYLLENDMEKAEIQAKKWFLWFPTLDAVRQDVVLEMIFNVGIHSFSKFTKMIAAITRSDWDRAASEMLASEWSSEVKKRAVVLADMMRAGVRS